MFVALRPWKYVNISTFTNSKLLNLLELMLLAPSVSPTKILIDRFFPFFPLDE